MRRMDIVSWAAMAEIIASVSVVISLIFVIASMNQNTAALRAISDNFLYELQDSQQSDVHKDPVLARIILKYEAGETLSNLEEIQFDYWANRQVNMWELAFHRYQDGLMSQAHWGSWERSFDMLVISYIPEEKWEQWRDFYGIDFQKYIDAKYSTR